MGAFEDCKLRVKRGEVALSFWTSEPRWREVCLALHAVKRRCGGKILSLLDEGVMFPIIHGVICWPLLLYGHLSGRVILPSAAFGWHDGDKLKLRPSNR